MEDELISDSDVNVIMDWVKLPFYEQSLSISNVTLHLLILHNPPLSLHSYLIGKYGLHKSDISNIWVDYKRVLSQKIQYERLIRQ